MAGTKNVIVFQKTKKEMLSSLSLVSICELMYVEKGG